LKKGGSLLKILSSDEINRYEPNGSTALHIACRNGHVDIIRALLERGASRRQLDQDNRAPLDENENEKIKECFYRSSGSTNERFVSAMPDMEWMIAGNEGFQIACDNIYLSKQFENLGEANQSISHANELKDAQGMDQIRYWLRKSEQNNDISYLVRTYSAQTDFFRRINYCFAHLASHQYTEEERQLWFVKFGKTLHKSK
jgi:hypothetical protein